MKKDVKSMLPDELEEYFLKIGEKRYRAKQVFSWLHKGVKSFDEMTDLPLELREKLSEYLYLSVPKLLDKRVSKKDGTVKYLWLPGGDSLNIVGDDSQTALDNANTFTDGIESVLMDYHHGITICVSTQIGCKMGCAFCASTIGGWVRNLSASEMLDQVLFSSAESQKRISNIVLMGIGEPLDNFDNVMRFVALATHQKGLNIGARHVTLSTCGVIENIDKMAACGVQLMLAISLHAPDDETRNKLVPYNRVSGIKALVEAAKRYTEKTGRRVTYEYTMIDGVNDSPEQAIALSKLLKNTTSHLNLISLSSVSECGFVSSKKENFELFAYTLKKHGVNFSIRRSLGADIESSCGQLRRKSKNGCMGHN
ncbi:MAG: 23S rRNA (adenine(2503)-C(2))-methyltransferase RlmN [Oscillospiraceae bacterium]|nr:23S rRNA (adenine(2503)-C(2))-methyltransferase RlmN [Oscillospiraceae bacterium]